MSAFAAVGVAPASRFGCDGELFIVGGAGVGSRRAGAVGAIVFAVGGDGVGSRRAGAVGAIVFAVDGDGVGSRRAGAVGAIVFAVVGAGATAAAGLSAGAAGAGFGSVAMRGCVIERGAGGVVVAVVGGFIAGGTGVAGRIAGTTWRTESPSGNSDGNGASASRFAPAAGDTGSPIIVGDAERALRMTRPFDHKSSV